MLYWRRIPWHGRALLNYSEMFLKLLNFIFILLEVLVIFNLLIIVHELGHFLAARWRGLVIEKFAIWFGKPIWSTTRNGIQYSLGSIPAGGFVALPQMAPMELVEGRSENIRGKLPPITALDKIIVAIAGPLFSFLLALFFATIVWVIGRPTTEAEATTTIGYVEKGSPADKAGLLPGDVIQEIDGQPVHRFLGMGTDSVTWRIIRSEGDKIAFNVLRDGKPLLLYSGWVKEPPRRFARSNLREVKIAPRNRLLIDRVEPGTPAATAGLLHGDEIVQVNGENVYSPAALQDQVSDHPDVPVSLVVLREGARLPFKMTSVLLPGENGVPRPRIGIQFGPGDVKLVHPTPVEQVASVLDTMANTLDALFSPKSDIGAQHFSGPVGIMRIYYQIFDSEDGWRLAFWFSVFSNVNLAVLNLLPIPVLDGGHILLALVEGARRKPVNAKVIEVITGVCAFVIIGFLLFVSFFDVRDLPWTLSDTKPGPGLKQGASK